MAIGLANAIGLGGKRTPLFEGMDEEVGKIGAGINAKLMAEERIKREAEQKAKDALNKQIESLSKEVMFDPKGKTDIDNEQLKKIGAGVVAQAMNNWSNPNMSYLEKTAKQQELLQDFANKVNFAEKEYKEMDDFYTKAQDKTNDVSAMEDLLSGNYGSFETKLDEKGNEISVPVKSNPLLGKYQSTKYHEIPLEDRMKMGIDLKKEKENRITTKKADLNEGIAKHMGGNDWASVFIDKHQLANGTTDPKTIDAVVKRERTAFIGALDQDKLNPEAQLELDKAKKLYEVEFLRRNYPKEEAAQKAEDLAKLDMLNTFDQRIKDEYQKEVNKRDANPENPSGGKDGYSATDTRATVTQGFPKQIAEKKKEQTTALTVKKSALDTREENIKRLLQNPAYSDKEKKSLNDALQSIAKNRKAIDEQIGIINTIPQDASYVLFSQQFNTDDSKLVLGATEMKPTNIYESGGKLYIGGVSEKKEKDPNGGSDAKEITVTTFPSVEVTPEVWRTLSLNKKKFDKEIARAIKEEGKGSKLESVYNNFVSSQKGSEKKAEVSASFYKPKQALKASEIDVKKLKPNEVYIVDGIERVYIDGQLKKVKK